MMKNLLLLFVFIFSFQSYSQVNRFSKPVTPARYEARSFSEMAAPILMKKKLDKERECRNFLQTLKENVDGKDYGSPSSQAISKVTFYTVPKDGQFYYFAAVCFKQTSSYSCAEYIYLVESDTERKYASYYQTSAGDAFWEYIQPHRDNLSCGPDF